MTKARRTLRYVSIGIAAFACTALVVIGANSGVLHTVRTFASSYIGTATPEVEQGFLPTRIDDPIRWESADACSSTFLFKFGIAGTGNGQLNTPRGVAVTPTGGFVVADTANNRVQVFDPAGAFVGIVGSAGIANGLLNQPRGVAAAPNGNIVVADTANNRVQVFDSQGAFIRVIGGPGTGNGLFNQPRSVAVNTSGAIVVADTGNNRLQVFDSNGVFVRVVGGPGTTLGTFNQPGGVAVGPTGHFIVADTGNNRVQLVEPTGASAILIGGAGTALGSFNQPSGVAMTAGGNVVVADTGNNRVQASESTGTFILIGGPGTANGLFNQPSGVAVNAGGNIVVADTSNNRGQVFAGCPVTPAAGATGKIVYQRGGNSVSDLFTITPGAGPGVGIRPRGYHPAYSPDGSKIVYVDGNTGGSSPGDLMLMNADGSNVRRLATPRKGFSPTWSPDGSRLAFIRGDFDSTGDDGKGTMFIIDMTPGSEGANETQFPGTYLFSRPSWGGSNRIGAACMRPHPQGGMILYGICLISTIPPSSQLASNPPTVSQVSGVFVYDRDVSWSADGTFVAFQSPRDDPQLNSSQIYVMNPDGTGARRVTNTPGYKAHPSVSPDGTKIVFVKDGTQYRANADLSIVNTTGSNGTNPEVLTNLAAGDAFPNWGPTPTVTSVDLSMDTMVDEPDPVAVGSNYNYLFTLRNRGTSGATGVKIEFDPIPANISRDPLMTNCSMAADRRVTCTFANIAAGATNSASVTFVTAQSPTGPITLRAKVSANEIDPDDSNNSLTQTTTIAPRADLAILDVTAPSQITVGGFINYQVTLINYGPAPAGQINLRSIISPNLTYMTANTANGSCLRLPDGGQCSMEDFTTACPTPAAGCPAGSTATVNLRMRALASGSGPAFGKNIIKISSLNSADSQPSNNERTVSTDVVDDAIDLIGLEVTQSIQDLKNNVPLVAGRRTYVRAHVKKQSQGYMLGKATLLLRNPSTGQTLTIQNSNDGNLVRMVDRPKRTLLDDSFYFEIPNGQFLNQPQWTRPGPLDIVFQNDGFPVRCLEPDGNPNCETRVEFKTRRAFSMRLFVTSTKTMGGATVTPSDQQVVEALAEIAAMYPIANFGDDGVSIAIDSWEVGGYCTTNDIDRRLFELSYRKRYQDCLAGPCEDIYIALLPDPSTNPGICSLGAQSFGIGANNIGFPGEPGYPLQPPIGIKKDNTGNANVVIASKSAVAPHELGHNFGLLHTCFASNEPDCIDLRSFDGTATYPSGTISSKTELDDPETFLGFDVYRESLGGNSGCNGGQCASYQTDGRIYPPNAPDMMAYGKGRWISATSYKRIFDSLAPQSLRPDNGRSSAETNIFQIFGTVTSDGLSGQLTTVSSTTAVSTVAAPPTPSGTWSISIRNAQAVEIARYGMDFQTSSVPAESIPFSLTAPRTADARSVALLKNGQPVATRLASANPPAVTLTSPNGGQTLTGSSVNVEWTASDLDGDTLTYSIEYSADAGTTWKSIATDISGNNLVVDLTRRRASTQGLFRVTANDGFNSTRDASNAVFTIPAHPPLVTLTLPSAGQIFVGDQVLSLEGAAFDVEDGALPDSNLVWTSNLNGTLGTGSSLNISAAGLQEGTHTITLRGTDSSQMNSTTSTTVRVFRVRPDFPAEVAVSSTTLDFTANFGSGLSAGQLLAIRNAGDGDLSWTATASEPWIQLGIAEGSAPSDVSVTINADALPLGASNGTITITTTTPASTKVVNVGLMVNAGPPSAISGRVLTPDGRALRNAVVSIVNSQGSTRIATTSSFGVFSFGNVADDYYLVRVTSKRYRFATRTVQISNDLSLPDFVGLE